MADLSIEFCGIKSINPFWLASAPPTDKAYNVVRAFEAVTGGRIPYRVVERRPGDIAQSCAAVDAIGAEVGWHARRDVTAMVRDLWAWQEANPAGFSSRTE